MGPLLQLQQRRPPLTGVYKTTQGVPMTRERANRAQEQGLGEPGRREYSPPGGYGPGQCGQGQQLAGPRLTPSTFWNEDPRRRWLGRANVGLAILDGVRTTCLIDNGACINLVTPEFVKARDLDVGSIQDLNDHNGCIPLSGLGGNVTKPLGYVVIQVQIPYVLSYDEDQVALVVRDNSCFISHCPVVLGTPTINRVIQR